MKQGSNRRRILLDKANGVTSLLVLLSVLAIIPGAIRGFRFLQDSFDGVIELDNLIGWGNITLPGGISIEEPYATMAILIAAVAIPLLLAIALLVTKRNLGKEHIPGTGAYWFGILTAIAIIMTALGFTGMLFNGTPGGVENIDSSPYNLAVAGGGILMIISAVYAISLIAQGRSMNEPDRVNGVVESNGEPHYNKTLPADTAPIAIDDESEAGSLSDTVTLTDVPYDRPRIEQNVTLSTRAGNPMVREEPLPESPVSSRDRRDEVHDPNEEFRTDVALAMPGAVPDGVILQDPDLEEDDRSRDDFETTKEKISKEISEAGSYQEEFHETPSETAEHVLYPKEDPDGDHPNTLSEGVNIRQAGFFEKDAAPSVSEDPAKIATKGPTYFEGSDADPHSTEKPTAMEEPVRIAEEPPSNVADGENSLNAGSDLIDRKVDDITASKSRPEIMRRFLKFPGDDSKVIVIYREYQDGQLLREWAEIRPRSEFNGNRHIPS